MARVSVLVMKFSSKSDENAIHVVSKSANINLLKVNNRNTRQRCEICSKSQERHQNDVIDVVLAS